MKWEGSFKSLQYLQNEQNGKMALRKGFQPLSRINVCSFVEDVITTAVLYRKSYELVKEHGAESL